MAALRFRGGFFRSASREIPHIEIVGKRRAQRGGRRIPENTLHLMEVLGGWPGAFIAQRVFRHKTQKLSFRIVFWLCVSVHLAAVGGVIYLL